MSCGLFLASAFKLRQWRHSQLVNKAAVFTLRRKETRRTPCWSHSPTSTSTIRGNRGLLVSSQNIVDHLVLESHVTSGYSRKLIAFTPSCRLILIIHQATIREKVDGIAFPEGPMFLLPEKFRFLWNLHKNRACDVSINSRTVVETYWRNASF